MTANKLAFAIGLFESVKIPLAPFAYAFCPIGMSAKLTLIVEFFSKAFGFYNWYLSTLFPFASYFLVFAKQAHLDSYAGANMSIMASHLLHDGTVIDQVFETRRLLAETLCKQYFGIKIRADAPEDNWIQVGFQKYLSALLLRVFHGKNDYKYTLRTDLERAFELEPGKAPLHSTRIGSDVASREWFALKSRIVLCILERKLEKTGLQRVFMHLWSEACEGKLSGGVLTTKIFLKNIKKMTGKDMRTFADHWIFGSGAPLFSCSFAYNRKKSSIEVDLKQSTPGHPGKRYSGSLLIRVHEQEGVFDHSVHIDDFSHRFELPYHTKIRKMRKKRRSEAPQEPAHDSEGEGHGSDEEPSQVPRMEQEEEAEPEENNAAFTSETSPISWIRLDPDMDWYCGSDMHQPDFMWMEQLDHDRDVSGQHEAALKLCRHPSEAAAECFEKAALNWKFYYKIRVDALNGLVSCAKESVEWIGLDKIWSIFGRKYGLERQGKHPIPKPNLFDNLPNYFVLKAIPQAASMIRDEAGHVPDRVISFLVDLLRYNDNSYNTQSDNYYLATAIGALGTAIRHKSPTLSPETEALALAEINRFARLERMLPYFRNTVMCAVLKAVPSAAVNELVEYLVPGHYIQVRLSAAEAILHSGSFSSVLEHLLQLADSDSNRKFALDLASVLERFSALIPTAESSLWVFVSRLQDENLTRAYLRLLNSCFEPASDDILEERAIETMSNLPSAAPTMPSFRLNMQVHELGSDEEDSGEPAGQVEEADWLNELADEAAANRPVTKARPIPKLKIQPLALNRTISHSEADGPMLTVLQTIWDNYDSFPFRYPVDPSVPGYYAIIRVPMDLSTMQSRAREGRYNNLEEMFRDLRLIFDNCFTFNQPGSLIYDQALRLRHFAYKSIKRAFPDQSKLAKRHLMASEPIVIVPEELRAAPVNAEVPKLKLSISMPTKVPSTPIPKLVIVPPQPQTPSPVKKSVASSVTVAQMTPSDVLDKLKSHQYAYWFAEPIDPIALGIPTYYEIVKEPMDFATITTALKSGRYDSDWPLFKRDIELVFSNAKLFNPLSTLVHQHAIQMEKYFHRLWNKSSVSQPQAQPQASPLGPVAGGLKIKLSLGGPTASPSWESSALTVLKSVSEHEYAVFFLEPVDPVALGCPTYFDEISHPMDISTMRSKLKRHEYQGPKEFMDDFKLMVKNCIKFNGEESGIAGMAKVLQNTFNSLCAKNNLK